MMNKNLIWDMSGSITYEGRNNYDERTKVDCDPPNLDELFGTSLSIDEQTVR